MGGPDGEKRGRRNNTKWVLDCMCGVVDGKQAGSGFSRLSPIYYVLLT